MGIKEFNRQNLDVIDKEIEFALEAVGEKYGLTFENGSITYGPSSFSFKITCTIGGNKMEALRNAFMADIQSGYGRLYQVSESDFGGDVIINGKRHIFVGFNKTARKNVIKVIDASSGKEYVISDETYNKCKK